VVGLWALKRWEHGVKRESVVAVLGAYVVSLATSPSPTPHILISHTASVKGGCAHIPCQERGHQSGGRVQADAGNGNMTT
jgi:hypothetical protein